MITPKLLTIFPVFLPTNIVLRKHVGTMFKCGVNTIVKAIKFVPPLPHPVLEYKPPMFALVQVWRIGGKIP